MFLSKEEKIARLRLIRTPLIGPVRYRKLVNVYGGAQNALFHLPKVLELNKKFKISEVYPEKEALIELELAEKKDINIVFYGDEFYPEAFNPVSSASPLLFVKSKNLSALKKINGVGIVGTRNSSIVAEKFCYQLSADIAKSGNCVVSGMAQGIDAFAHSGALSVNSDFPTVAVLAGGVDVIYPLKNRFLYEEIIEKNGAIVSERPIGSQPSANFFPVRNRIIVGLCKGVIVIEAKAKSGSLITAEYAKEMNRVAMAVPGFPTDERAGGPNYLLKYGAKLIENIDDVKAALINIGEENKEDLYQNIFSVNEIKFVASNDNIDDLKELVLSKLSKTPIDIEELISNLNVTTPLVLRALLELELAEKIVCSSTNTVSKI